MPAFPSRLASSGDFSPRFSMRCLRPGVPKLSSTSMAFLMAPSPFACRAHCSPAESVFRKTGASILGVHNGGAEDGIQVIGLGRCRSARSTSPSQMIMIPGIRSADDISALNFSRSSMARSTCFKVGFSSSEGLMSQRKATQKGCLARECHTCNPVYAFSSMAISTIPVYPA